LPRTPGGNVPQNAGYGPAANSAPQGNPAPNAAKQMLCAFIQHSDGAISIDAS